MIVILFFLCLLFPVNALAAVAFGTQASVDVSGDTSVNTLSFSFTCTNSNTKLYVASCIKESTTTPTTVSAISYNGLTLSNFADVVTRVSPASGTRNLTLSVWRAVAGSACNGSANTLQVDISAAKIWGVGVLALTGVDTTDPDDTPVVVATDGTPAIDGATGNITSATDDLVAGFICRRNNQTLTTVAGQTDHYNYVTNHTTGSSNVRGIGATEAGNPVDIGWTSGGSSQEWIVVGFNVNQTLVVQRRRPPPRHFLRFFDFLTPVPVHTAWRTP